MHKIFIISDKTLTLKHVAKLNKLLYPHHFSLSLFIKAKYRHYLTFCTLLDVQKKTTLASKSVTPIPPLENSPTLVPARNLSLSLSLFPKKVPEATSGRDTRRESESEREKARDRDTRASSGGNGAQKAKGRRMVLPLTSSARGARTSKARSRARAQARMPFGIT